MRQREVGPTRRESFGAALDGRAFSSRFGATLAAALLSLLLPSCDRGYPIEPTLCDRQCAAENRIHCENEIEPALCISECEKRRALDSRNASDIAGRCDGPRSAFVECLEALPDSDFTCVGGSVIRRHGTCLDPAIGVSFCQTRTEMTWEGLCSNWARGCADSANAWSDLNRECSSSNWTNSICSDEQRSLLHCLRDSRLRCDTKPSRQMDLCTAERAAVERCDPRFQQLCMSWGSTWSRCNDPVDAGIGRAGQGDPKSDACWMSRPPDLGPRCLHQREDLYECLVIAWSVDFNRPCPRSLWETPGCESQRARFEACAMASDDGGS